MPTVIALPAISRGKCRPPLSVYKDARVSYHKTNGPRQRGRLSSLGAVRAPGVPQGKEGIEVIFAQIAPGAVRAVKELVFNALAGEARNDKEAQLVMLRAFRQDETVIAASGRVTSRHIVKRCATPCRTAQPCHVIKALFKVVPHRSSQG
jgi:hypothetical protein